MVRFVRALSARTEFIIVIGVAFGLSIFGSVMSIFNPLPHAPINEKSLITLLVYEPIVFVLLYQFLRMRGWTRSQLGLTLNWPDTLSGLGLAAVSYLIYVAVWIIFAMVAEQMAKQIGKTQIVDNDILLVTMILASIINPIFEEVFVCGYIVTVIKLRRTLWYAINVSTAVRLSYHLYQGPAAVVGILPLGIVFAYWYARTSRLWPVIVAHAVFDFLSLLAYVRI